MAANSEALLYIISENDHYGKATSCVTGGSKLLYLTGSDKFEFFTRHNPFPIAHIFVGEIINNVSVFFL